MAGVPSAAAVNAQNAMKKHFLGMPAPLGYVAGVGRGATGKLFFSWRCLSLYLTFELSLIGRFVCLSVCLFLIGL